MKSRGLYLGFQFDRHNDRWESRYCDLIEFKAAHGHCNVPDSWPENLRLARWVMTQRQMHRKGKLSPDRIQRLEAIGFIWCRQEHAWDEMYQRLVRYKSAHGDCNVPSGVGRGPSAGQLGGQAEVPENQGTAEGRTDKETG